MEMVLLLENFLKFVKINLEKIDKVENNEKFFQKS